jgi:hypothetical protein
MDDDEDEVFIPKNAKISKNIGRETPGYNGPNGLKYHNTGIFFVIISLLLAKLRVKTTPFTPPT